MTKTWAQSTAAQLKQLLAMVVWVLSGDKTSAHACLKIEWPIGVDEGEDGVEKNDAVTGKYTVRVLLTLTPSGLTFAHDGDGYEPHLEYFVAAGARTPEQTATAVVSWIDRNIVRSWLEGGTPTILFDE